MCNTDLPVELTKRKRNYKSSNIASLSDSVALHRSTSDKVGNIKQLAEAPKAETGAARDISAPTINFRISISIQIIEGSHINGPVVTQHRISSTTIRTAINNLRRSKQ